MPVSSEVVFKMLLEMQLDIFSYRNHYCSRVKKDHAAERQVTKIPGTP